ncbi:MAG: hypothetical protein MUE41_17120 [Gemmatimonadaceae bacterium]|nr:hypothetical protein [Gemmatimonadaceae bacterium]
MSDIAAAIDDFRAWFKDIEPAPVVLHESAVPLVDDVDTTDDDIPAELRARIDALLSSITVGH